MSVPFEPLILRDIYDYTKLPFWGTIAGCLSILLVVVVILLPVAWCMARWVFSCKPIRPEQAASSRLEALVMMECQSRDDFRRLYFDLTDIVKSYLQARFQLKLSDKTDLEMARVLKKASIKEEIVQAVKTVFEGAQGVRFANELALVEQVRRDLKLAQRVVVLGAQIVKET